MSEITAAKVKELRDKTGAGMMDAKKALVENDGDMDQSVDWLRTKGLAKAAKKSGRTAAEGLVALAVSEDGKDGVIVEVNAETDFVSRNEKFQEAVNKIAQTALESGTQDIDALGNMDLGGKSVNDTLTDLIATIGENMQLRRFERICVDNGVIGQYMHNPVSANLGQIGVLVGLVSNEDQATLKDVGKKIAMHIAALKPEALKPEDLSQDRVEREKNILREKASESGKPADIIEKMLEGQIRKFYSEICLLQQTFVIDGENTVEKYLEQAGKDIAIADYKIFVLGEGIEKEEEDFAEEVKNAVNG